ncbi:MAG TPA: hypothetical protein VGN34_25245, partial [Ktedonobacteraceae bacterium]
LTQAVAKLEEQSGVLQKKADLAKSRYDSNEKREELMRDTIQKLDENTIKNKRQIYESLVTNQRKLDALQVHMHLLDLQTRRMLLAGIANVIPGGVQREMQGSWNNVQALIRSW